MMVSDRRNLIHREAKRRSVCTCRKKLLAAICAMILFFVWFFFVGNSTMTMLKALPRRPVVGKAVVIKASTENALPVNRTKQKKLVILWTPFFSQRNYVLPLDRYSCSQTDCEFISNRSLIREADAVMFHARDTDLKDLPNYRSHAQRWILLHHEAPPNTPKDLMQGLDHLINWTVTYRSDSDVVLTPKYQKIESNGSLSRPAEHGFANKTRLVAWFVSNCQTDSKREDFAQQLRKTVTIDIFGSCGPFTCHPKMSHKCYQTIEREYFFYLSLENAICKDYVTEKLFNILDYNIVPIVFGGNQADFLPAESYIDVFAFDSTAELGQYLIFLTKHQEEYERYFHWKQEYQMAPYQHYACQLCSKLHSDTEPVKTWHNLSNWWIHDAKCRSWSPPADD